MRLAVHHRLTLALAPGATRAVEHVLLAPRSGPTQTVHDWSVTVGDGQGARFEDAFGNLVHLVNQARTEPVIEIVASGLVETHDRNGVLGRPRGDPAPAVFKRLRGAAVADEGLLAPFRQRALNPAARLSVLHGLMAALKPEDADKKDEAAAAPQAESAPLPPQTMAADGSTTTRSQGQSQSQSRSDGRAGTPRQTEAQGSAAVEAAPDPDPVALAHAFIGAARALDIPARFVTGYLWTGEVAGDLHAWAEAYVEALGWIGFDPSLGVCPTDRHIRVATGFDAESAAPVRSVPLGTLQTVSLRVEAAPTP